MMNERLTELATQAGLGYMFGQNPSALGMCRPEDIVKFANLIVADSIRVADDNFDKGFCPVGGYIAEHFGVEE